MSDSNIYMALAQSLCFPSSECLERTGGSTREEWRQAERDRGRLLLQNRGWSISDAICPPHYFRIRWSPSPSSSGEEAWWEKKHIKSLSNTHLPESCYRPNYNSRGYQLVTLYELTFDSADQKTALVRQVVNHLEKTKQTRWNQISLSTCRKSGSLGF